MTCPICEVHAPFEHDCSLELKKQRDELREQVARLKPSLGDALEERINAVERAQDVQGDADKWWRKLQSAAIERNELTAERDELREQVARLEGEVGRWKQEFRSYAVHDDARCEHFGKCQCGLAELLAECAEGGEP